MKLALSQLKLILPVLVLLVAGGIYQLLLASKPEADKPVLREKIWQISVVEAVPGRLSPTVTLYGRIESPEQLKAASPGSGVVAQVYVRDGASVTRGQPLVMLDQRDFEAALIQARANLRDIENQIAELKIRHQADRTALTTERELMALAQAEVERLAKLQQQNLSADTALNSARSELGRQQLAVTSRQLEVDRFPAQLEILNARREREQARLDEARLAVSRSDVRAPFDAIISDVAVAAGDRVSLGQILVTLFPMTGLEIRAHLPLNHIEAVQQAITANAELVATVESQPELGRFALERLAGEAEATGIDAYFSVTQDSVQLRPGELLPLSLQLPPEADVFAVPFQAIYGNSRLYRVVDERLEAIEVDSVGQMRGPGSETRVLVRSNNLAAGDLIAATHLPNAVTGLKVRIDER